MILRYHKIVAGAKDPVRATRSDAGWDVFALESYRLMPGQRVIVSTGLVVWLEYPDHGVQLAHAAAGLSWYLRVADKSGHAQNLGLHVMGGVIDLGYRGELRLVVANLGFYEVGSGLPGGTPVEISAGMKVAQLVPTLIPDVSEARETFVIDEGDRGDAGFGSSGSF